MSSLRGKNDEKLYGTSILKRAILNLVHGHIKSHKP